MSNTVIRKAKLEKFCEFSLNCYKKSIRESCQQTNLRQLRKILEMLADDCEKLEGVDIGIMARQLVHCINNSVNSIEKIVKKTNRILELLERLSNEYKDYIQTVHVTKKISIVSTLNYITDSANDNANDNSVFEVDLSSNWKCKIF